MDDRLAALSPALVAEGWRYVEDVYANDEVLVVRCTTPLPLFPTALAKIMKLESPEAVALLRREYDLLTQLRHCPHIIRVIGFVEHPRACFLAEDHKSVSVGRVRAAGREFSLAEKMTIALGATRGLDAVHQARLLHCDLNSINVLVNTSLTRVMVVAFQRAVRLPVPPGTVYSGVPAYMAPEHSGRTEATMDTRSDIYSLGMFLYELFADRLPLPLPTSSPDWIHAHLATVMPSAASLASELVPPLISAMIDITLKKDKSDRYQSAHGLERDLARFESERALGADPFTIDFPLRLYDRAATLHPVPTLLGRDKEMAALMGVFEKMLGGQYQTVFLPGPSGMGKTALIDSFRLKALSVRRDLLLGYAKCDVHRRTTPYHCLVQLLESFTESFLARGATYVSEVQREMLSNMSPAAAAVLVEMVPVVERLLGPQQPVGAETRGDQRKELLTQGVARFFQALGTQERPALFVAENFQHADEGTLEMAKFVMGENKIRYMMNINLIRSDDMPSNTGLTKFLEAMNANTHATFITLEPLGAEHVQQLVSLSLALPPEECTELSALIVQHGGGSPFHTTALLQTCQAEKLLEYDYAGHRFTFDVEKIRQRLTQSEDVADIIAARLALASPDVSQLLARAACIGAEFAVDVLCKIMAPEVSPSDVYAWLRLAEDHGFLISLARDEMPRLSGSAALRENSPRMRFSHRKVHSGVLAHHAALVSPTHVRIALYMLARAGGTPRELPRDVAYAVCGHVSSALNTAAASDGTHLTPEVLRRGVSVALTAVRAAVRSIAFEPANEFLSLARQALEKLAAVEAKADIWEADYDLCVALYKEQLALSDDAHVHVETALTRVKTTAEQIALLVIKMRALAGQGKYQETLDFGRRAMRSLGEPLPDTDEQADTEIKYLQEAIDSRLEAGALQASLDKPLSGDVAHLTLVAETLSGLTTAVYLGFQKFLPIVPGRALLLVLEHGWFPPLCYPATCYCTPLLQRGKALLAYKVGQTAVEIESRLGVRPHQTETMTANITVTGHFAMPFHQLPVAFAECYRGLRDNANLNTASICAASHCRAQALNASHLGTWLNSDATREMVAYNLASKHRGAIGVLRSVLAVSYQLSFGPRWLSNMRHDHPGFTTDEYPKSADEFNTLLMDSWSGGAYAILRSLYFLCMDRPHDAYELAKKAPSLLLRGHADILGIICFFVMALSAAELLIDLKTTEEQRADIRATLALAVETVAKQRALGPANLACFDQVVRAANIAATTGFTLEAINLFNEGVNDATTRRLWHVALLAHRWLSRAWQAMGAAGERYSMIEDEHADAARQQWGIVTPTVAASSDHSHHSTSTPHIPPLEEPMTPDRLDASGGSMDRSMSMGIMGATANEGIASVHLDAASIMRASRAISSELHLPRLLQTLMQILMESVGAQAIAVLRPDGDDYVLESAVATEAATLSRATSSLFERENSAGSDAGMSASGGGGLRAQMMNRRQAGSPAVPPIVHLTRDAPLRPEDAPLTLLNTCIGLGGPVVVADARADVRCALDPHVVRHQPVSILCAPLLSRGKVVRVVYVQNNLSVGAFSPRRLNFFESLASQAAVSIENAFLYTQLEGEKRQLEVARDAAVKADKAKSEFLAMISHEIRTPMNGIMTMVTLLKSAGLDPEFREHLDIISTSGEILLHLIESVLDFSSLESGRFEIKSAPLSIVNSIAACTKLVGITAAAKGLQLNVVDSRVPILVIGDAVRLRQIVINLVTNAIKYTEKGSITLSYSGRDLTGGAVPQYELHVRVQDTGIGISAENIAKLFKPFSQVDSSSRRRVEGVGLGLAITQTLVVKMGGRVWVESMPNVGSTFHATMIFGLDAAPETAFKFGTALETTASSAPSLPQDLCIVIVDDNTINQRVLSKLLQKMQYPVAAVASNGREAVRLVEESTKPIDLILMDVFMPEMDGMQASEAIRALPSKVHQPVIIAVTASALDGDRERFLAHGMNDYLCKPLQVEALTSMLQSVLTGRLTANTK